MESMWVSWMTDALITCTFLLLLLRASAQDVASHCLEDEHWKGVLLLALYCGALPWLGLVLPNNVGWMSRLMGALTGAVPLLAMALWKPGSIGGGDVKLQAAIGLFLGSRRAETAFLAAMYGAAVYALWYLLKKRSLYVAKEALLVNEAEGREGSREIALGPFLCAGAAVAVFV